MINVTKTFLPPQHEYGAILKRAWDLSWITNRGSLVKELEYRLKNHLGVSHLLATTNGTLPIQLAIRALGISGEVITTPFSYVATVSSIVWEGCTPVFVDIDPTYFTIDESKIEDAITDQTSAILATHVFGNPCNVEYIEQIALKYKLRVIYDAAHCFDVDYKNTSIFNYGDVSTCSFHATKLFHTGEGGAAITQSKDLYDKLFSGHNFGHKGREDFDSLGINAKMSELQAALGLAVLEHIPSIKAHRSSAVAIYRENLGHLRSVEIREGTNWNFAYYPVLFASESDLLKAISKLNDAKIFPRRYFYPSLNNLPYVNNLPLPVSEDIAGRILCLPLSHDITEQEQMTIIKLLK